MDEYEKSSPAVYDYLDGLYRRVCVSQGEEVRLVELVIVRGLYENGRWEQANYAQNRIYRLMHRLGMDTRLVSDF